MQSTMIQTPDIRPAGFHVAALIDELETEQRLLVELTRVLVSQRDGISRNDLAAIDESTFAAQRVLLTLQQARLRRRNLLELLGVDQESELSSLETTLGPLMTHDLTESRDALVRAASELERELDVNKRVIHGALDIGDRLLRAFTGQLDTPPVYSNEATAGPSGSSGVLLNTRV